MKSRSSIIKAVTAVVLVAALAVPVYAFAVPGMGKMGPKANSHASVKQAAKRAAKMAAKQAALTARIDKVLANRARAFENAASKIDSRIASATVLMNTVPSPADTTGVAAALADAKTDLDAARLAEAAANDLFRAVPTATDRRAAFAAAKAKAHEARMLLKDARAHLSDAISKLEAIVAQLQTVAATPEVTTP